MKEASGEVSMTLIVIVAAAAILGIFLAFRPAIVNFIDTKWNNFGSQADKNCKVDKSTGVVTCN